MALQEEFEKQGIWLFTYRSVLPLIILVIGTILYLYSEIYPETFILRGTPYETFYNLLCLLVCMFGLIIRIYTVGHSAKNTSGRNTEEQVADSLNSTGIYSMVRHPLYLGNYFMWLGPAMLSGNLWFNVAFTLFYWVYYERIMFAEEQFLRRKFGTVYTDWASGVPAFIPSFKKFVKPALPFSWKKVIKKEKNGLAAVFLIFCAFDIAGELINGRQDFNYFLIGACIFTGVLYIILKFIKSKTRLLDEADR